MGGGWNNGIKMSWVEKNRKIPMQVNSNGLAVMVPVIYYPLRSMPSVILGFKPWFLISCLLTQYSVSKNHSR